MHHVCVSKCAAHNDVSTDNRFSRVKRARVNFYVCLPFFKLAAPFYRPACFNNSIMIIITFYTFSICTHVQMVGVCEVENRAGEFL